MNVVAIIPARGGSTRLLRKNIRDVWGKPMIYWSIKAAQKSKYINDIYVTSDDDEILNISEGFGANTIKRPKDLSDNFTYKQFAITHALDSIKRKYDIVVSLQANSPQIKHSDIDASIEKLIKYNVNEVFTVDQNLVQHGAFRIWKYKYAFEKALSFGSSVYIANYVDVHTEDDLISLESKYDRPEE